MKRGIIMKKKLLQKIGVFGLAVIMAVGNPCIALAQMEEALDENVFIEEFTDDADVDETAIVEEESIDTDAFGEENVFKADKEEEEDISVFEDGDYGVDSEPGKDEVLFTAGDEETAETSDFTYTLDAATGTAIITGYTGTETEITIPTQIVDRGITYQVKAIRSAAFGGNRIIRSVQIEEGIEQIGSQAFSNCEYLEKVVMSDSIVTLGNGYPGIFENCVRLKSVKLSEGIKNIPENCFRNCSSLSEVAIPGNVESIYAGAFESCSSLSSVDFTGAGKLAEIENSAFADCNLEYVDFPLSFTKFCYVTGGGYYYGYFDENPIKKMIFHENYRGCDDWSRVRVTNNKDAQVIVIYSKDISMNSPEFGENAEIYGVSGTKIQEMAERTGKNFFPINAVSNLKTEKVDNSTVKLTWNTVSPVARYKIYRAEEPNGAYEELGIVSGTEYIDAAAKEDSVNYYKMCITYTDCLGETVDGFMSNVVKGDLTRIDIADADIEEIAEIEYTGKEICPEIKAFYNGNVLEAGKDYTLSYADNIEIGKASIMVTGIHDYKSERIVNFDIIPVRRDIANATVDSINDIEYTGKAITPNLTIKYDGTELIEGQDYQLSYKDNVKVGQAKIVITGIHAYKGSKIIYFKIKNDVPGQPDISNISVVRNKYVKIKWKAVSGATGYRLYRRSKGSSWKSIKTLSGTGFTDKSVKFGQKYAYTVKAFKKVNGKTYWSTYNETGKTITVTLSAPVLSSAKASGYNTTKITWKKVPGATGYRVYRKDAGSGKYKSVAALKNVSTFTDKKAPGGKTYIYTVRAYKKSGKKIIRGNCNSAGISVKSRRQPRRVTLSTNKTYTKYDITGDGKNDRITLTNKKKASSHNLTIRINGKKAFSFTQKGYTPKKFDVQLCTTEATEEFVSIRYESGDNDHQTFHKMYKYAKGKLKCVMNVQKELKIQSMQFSGVESVLSNLIVFSARGIASNGFRDDLCPYGVKDGKIYH